jgi:SNF2 family DNA or RNA helicase
MRGTKQRHDNAWSFPPDPDVLDDLRESDLCLDLDEGVRNLEQRYRTRRAQLDSGLAITLAGKYAPKHGHSDLEYDAHQINGAAWMIAGKRLILNDKFGAGKTITAIRAIEKIIDSTDRILIITERIYQEGWRRALVLWLGKALRDRGFYVEIIHGPVGDRADIVLTGKAARRCILITNYQAIPRKEKRSGEQKGLKFGGIPYLDRIEWDILILDEPHHVKNRKTKVYNEIKALAAPPQRQVWMATGALIHNTPADVWALLSILHPSRFTSYWQFVERYCIVNQGIFGTKVGGLREDRRERFVKTLKQYATRREIIYPFRVNKLHLDPADYKGFAATYESIIKTNMVGDRFLTSAAALLTTLCRYITDPESVGIMGVEAPKLVALRTLLAQDPGPVVVASRFTSEFPRYQKMFQWSQFISQDTPHAMRQDIIDDFQNGDIPLLFLGIRSGGTAITLTRSHHMFQLSPDFNPVMNEQVMGRLIRRGQEITVQVHEPVVMGTLDDWVQALLAEKINVIKYVQENGLTDEVLHHRSSS